MYSHRIALLLMAACWLVLPAIVQWWLNQPQVLALTFVCWAGVIALLALSDLRRPR